MRRLRAWRLKRFLTQQALAERVGVPTYTVQRWEAGDAFPRPSFLQRLCAALEVSPDELVEADEWPAARRAKTAVAA